MAYRNTAITRMRTKSPHGRHILLIHATNVSVANLSQPVSWKLAAVWPSPVRESANISITSRGAGLHCVELFDALGPPPI